MGQNNFTANLKSQVLFTVKERSNSVQGTTNPTSNYYKIQQSTEKLSTSTNSEKSSQYSLYKAQSRKTNKAIKSVKRKQVQS